jgi:hypothetical protein
MVKRERLISQDRNDNNITSSQVSASFYPVSAAIAVRSELDELLVMTTRTQGGTSLRRGQVELMHSRRLIYDDKLSKEVILNDTEDWFGARGTHSTYYVQLYDRRFEKSL